MDATGDPVHMTHLGGLYLGVGRTDLALRYYRMAERLGHAWAYVCLGDIWHDGKAGQKDLKKAFEYYVKAADAGNINAAYLAADMYKNGEYVSKDYDRYCSIIEDLCGKVKDEDWISDVPVEEVLVRLGEIRASQGREDEAIKILMDAREILTQELQYVPAMTGTMERVINDLYELIEFDPSDSDLFDLFYLLKTPRKVRFRNDGQVYEVESFREGDEITVSFDGRWFRSVKEFFEKAFIGEDLPAAIADEFYGWEVL